MISFPVYLTRIVTLSPDRGWYDRVPAHDVGARWVAASIGAACDGPSHSAAGWREVDSFEAVTVGVEVAL